MKEGFAKREDLQQVRSFNSGALIKLPLTKQNEEESFVLVLETMRKALLFPVMR